MIKQKKLWDNILTVIMALLCLLWIYPIVLILLNSLKKEGTFTTSTVFQLPTSETFAGLSNYVYGVIKMGFLSSLGYSLLITVSSVVLILLCQYFWPGGVQPGGVVLCIVLFSTPVETYVAYALNRIFDTAVGVIVALLVNYFLPRERVVACWEKVKGLFRPLEHS